MAVGLSLLCVSLCVCTSGSLKQVEKGKKMRLEFTQGRFLGHARSDASSVGEKKVPPVVRFELQGSCDRATTRGGASCWPALSGQPPGDAWTPSEECHEPRSSHCLLCVCVGRSGGRV